MTSIYFTKKLQALVNAYQVNDHAEAKSNVEFMSHLYQLFLADDADLPTSLTEATEDMLGTVLREWAQGQATVYQKHAEIADKALGVVIADALRVWVWNQFLDYFESGAPDQVYSYEHWLRRENAPMKLVS